MNPRNPSEPVESPVRSGSSLDELRPQLEDNTDSGRYPATEALRLAVYGMPDDRSEVTGILCQDLGLNSVEAAIRAREFPCVLQHPVGRAEGERVVAHLHELGLQSELVPADQVPNLHEAHDIHSVSLHDDGLRVYGLWGTEQQSWPWLDLCLVSAGEVVSSDHHSRTLDDSHFTTAGRHTTIDHSTVPDGPRIWIYLQWREPATWLRIDHQRMNYGYLGERKSTSATANLHELLADLHRFGGCAHWTPSARALFERGPLAMYRFDSIPQLERMTVIQSLVARHFAAPA